MVVGSGSIRGGCLSVCVIVMCKQRVMARRVYRRVLCDKHVFRFQWRLQHGARRAFLGVGRSVEEIDQWIRFLGGKRDG